MFQQQFYWDFIIVIVIMHLININAVITNRLNCQLDCFLISGSWLLHPVNHWVPPEMLWSLTCMLPASHKVMAHTQKITLPWSVLDAICWFSDHIQTFHCSSLWTEDEKQMLNNERHSCIDTKRRIVKEIKNGTL